MTFYSLLVVNEQKELHGIARNRNEALFEFGKQLRRGLTLDNNGAEAPYLLDEWEESPHWMNWTILVYVSRGSPCAGKQRTSI